MALFQVAATLSALMISAVASATLVVPAHNENYCRNLDHIIPVVRTSAGGSHILKTGEILSYAQNWTENFKRAQDSVILNNRQPLCVGLLQDMGAPNAVAYGRGYILMGVSLLGQMARLSGGDRTLLRSTEKFVLAHEYAHFIQNLHGLKFNYILPMLSTKIKEQHADCMAAFLLRMSGEIPDSRIPSIEAFIKTLADAHVVGDHGTSEQRLTAFRSGSALARLHMASGGRADNTTSSQLIQACGHYYRPTGGI